jgi:hypothetical protein
MAILRGEAIVRRMLAPPRTTHEAGSRMDGPAFHALGTMASAVASGAPAHLAGQVVNGLSDGVHPEHGRAFAVRERSNGSHEQMNGFPRVRESRLEDSSWTPGVRESRLADS